MRMADPQPVTTEIRMADGIFMKTMVIANAGDVVPQHSHVFAHVSVLVRGAVRMHRDGLLLGDFVAPWAVFIPAHTMHTFQALAADTAILCVHDIGTALGVEIDAEHQIVEGA